MPSITLTDPVTGTTVASGLIATNNANLRNLLNSGLDYVNLKGAPALVVNEIPQWNGTQFIKGPAITTSAFSGGPPGTPKDGDIWIATNVGGTSGPRWTFGYNAGSPLADKWEFLGGSAYWINGATAPPNTGVVTTLLSFTAPRGGVYLISGGFFGSVGAAGAGNFATGVGINSVLQSTTGQITSAASTFMTISGLPWILTVTASQVINLMGSANQTITGVNESMAVLPIRVS